MAEGPSDRADEGIQGTQTAWGLLTSPRVFLGLTVLLALVLAWAQTVPQRLAAGELAPRAPFAEAEALRSLGLDDVWVAWPVLLLGLLLTLVAAGLLLLRAQRNTGAGGPFASAFTGTTKDTIDSLRERLARALGKERIVVRKHGQEVSARRGFEPESIAVVVLGLAALVAGLFIGRANTFDARFELQPGAEDRAQLSVRDGDLFLPSARGLDLRCAAPDPMDARRHVACTLQTDPNAPLEEVTLMPGLVTRTSAGLTLTPLTEVPRFGGAAFDLVLRRDAGPERLRLQPAQGTKLGATGDELTAFAGPDGPMVVWKTASGEARLLAPPVAAAQRPIDPVLGGTALEYIPPTSWTIGAESHPESILMWLGIVFLALGLLALALVPSASITLSHTPAGTRVHIRSTNRAALVDQARYVLLEAP